MPAIAVPQHDEPALHGPGMTHSACRHLRSGRLMHLFHEHRAVREMSVLAISGDGAWRCVDDMEFLRTLALVSRDGPAAQRLIKGAVVLGDSKVTAGVYDRSFRFSRRRGSRSNCRCEHKGEFKDRRHSIPSFTCVKFQTPILVVSKPVFVCLMGSWSYRADTFSNSAPSPSAIQVVSPSDGDRQRQAEEWLHRRQLPWRAYVRRAVALLSLEDCRSGTASVHLRRGARYRLPSLRGARARRRDPCHQLTSPPRSGRYSRQRTHGALWPPAAGRG